MAADTDLTGNSMRLLFVDDDRINILLFEQICLHLPDVELQCAESATQALSLVVDWRPELLVLDLHLPDANGLELLSQLREAMGESALPAVLCTAELIDDVAHQAQAAGFAECWAKPLALNDVRAGLRQFAPVYRPALPT